MIHYQIQSGFNWFMCFSLWYMVMMLIKKIQKNQFFHWIWAAVLPINIGAFLWLLLNKEFFHWNYDIATGEPVDHYSTYGNCMLFCGIALAFNAVSAIVQLVRRGKIAPAK